MLKFLLFLSFWLISSLSSAEAIEDTIAVTSSVFEHHGMVPEENSAYSDNISIDISWANLPAAPPQLALICDDPKVDELGMVPTPFAPWVEDTIPASGDGLPGAMTRQEHLRGVVGFSGVITGIDASSISGHSVRRHSASSY